MNITKYQLENEISMLQNRKLKLEYANRIYNLYYGERSIFSGSAKETYIYLQGLKFGWGVIARRSDEVDNKEFTAYDYFKNRIDKGFIIEAKKTTQDTYFSQCKNKYYINIEKLNSDFMYFTAKADVITPSGYKFGQTLHICMRTIKLDRNDSIDKIGEKVLRSINVSILELVKRDKNLGSDYLLWLTQDDLWYLGWSNKGLLTKEVEFKVV